MVWNGVPAADCAHGRCDGRRNGCEAGGSKARRDAHLRYRRMLAPSIRTAPPVSCSCAGRSRTTTFTRSASAAALRGLGAENLTSIGR